MVVYPPNANTVNFPDVCPVSPFPRFLSPSPLLLRSLLCSTGGKHRSTAANDLEYFEYKIICA